MPRRGATSDLSIQQPILHRLGDVGDVEHFFTRNIRNRASDAADLVIGAGAQTHFGHRLAQQRAGGIGHGGECVELFARQAGVGARGTLACDLFVAGFENISTHRRCAGAGGSFRQFFPGDCRSFDVDVDAVEQGAGDFCEVSLHRELAEVVGGHVTFGCRVHRGDQHETCGEFQAAGSAGDGDDVVFEWLTQGFENNAGELR